MGGVFIAQWLNYPLVKIPTIPSNCHKYRIFRGLLGNIKFTDNSVDHSWPDMWASVSAGSPSILGTFAVYSSPPCRTGRAPHFDLGPWSKLLHLEAFASPQSYFASRPSLRLKATSLRPVPRRVPVSSHRGRSWLPQHWSGAKWSAHLGCKLKMKRKRQKSRKGEEIPFEKIRTLNIIF